MGSFAKSSLMLCDEHKKRLKKNKYLSSLVEDRPFNYPKKVGTLIRDKMYKEVSNEFISGHGYDAENYSETKKVEKEDDKKTEGT